MAVLRSIPNEFFTMIHVNYSLTSLILPIDCLPPHPNMHRLYSPRQTHINCVIANASYNGIVIY